MNRTIVAFDFDGTLIKGDSFLSFIRFYKGAGLYYILYPFIGLVWIFAIIGFYSKDFAKEKIFKFLFKGEDKSKFELKCKAFSKCLDDKLFVGVRAILNKYKSDGCELIIVSASIDSWLIPYSKTLGIHQVIATKIECKNDVLTGNFLTKNCNNAEKVNRILESFPNRKTYYLIAYGNSSGDQEMLNMADESYFRFFK